MKIAIIIDAWKPFIGGGQKLFWQLARGLVLNHHCQISIITRSLKNELGRKYNKKQEFYGGALEIIRLGRPLLLSNLMGRIIFPFQAAFFVLSRDYDLVHGSAFLPGLSLQLIKLLKRKTVTFSAIGLNHFWQITNPGLVGFILEQTETIITKKFKYDWVFTDDHNFYKKFGYSNISFIPNGVQLPIIRNVKKWDKFTFLFVGRLDKRKGLNYLLQAIKILKDKQTDVCLRIVGEGSEFQNYKNLSDSLGISRKVKFVGKVSDVQLQTEYRKANCLILSSIWEGQPLVLFEAWAAKLPVIATGVGSLPYFINKTNGYLVEPRNEKRLVEAMTQAVNNKQLERLGLNGFLMIKNKYSWEKTVKAYLDVFKRFLQ